MSRKLTREQVDARMEAYEQAAESFQGAWFDTDIEHEQGKIVEKKIREIAFRWFLEMGKTDRCNVDTETQSFHGKQR